MSPSAAEASRLHRTSGRRVFASRRRMPVTRRIPLICRNSGTCKTIGFLLELRARGTRFADGATTPTQRPLSGNEPEVPVHDRARKLPSGPRGVARHVAGRPALLDAATGGLQFSTLDQISVCSEISKASSTSISRYLTVDSTLEWPSSNCTARRFLVRR